MNVDLEEKRNKIANLKKELKEKDNVIVKLTNELNKEKKLIKRWQKSSKDNDLLTQLGQKVHITDGLGFDKQKAPRVNSFDLPTVFEQIHTKSLYTNFKKNGVMTAVPPPTIYCENNLPDKTDHSKCVYGMKKVRRKQV